jgi:RNA:NAD 2'-phosphotransferase (TPT1/KptA family)
MGQAKLRKQEIETLKQKLNQDFFYHGTTEANYEKIMRSGYLKVSSSTSNTQKAIFLSNSDMGASMMTAMRHVLPEGSKVKIFKIPASVINTNKLKKKITNLN